MSLATSGCFSPGGILPVPDWVPPLAWTLTFLVPDIGCWKVRSELGLGLGVLQGGPCLGPQLPLGSQQRALPSEAGPGPLTWKACLGERKQESKP